MLNHQRYRAAMRGAFAVIRPAKIKNAEGDFEFANGYDETADEMWQDARNTVMKVIDDMEEQDKQEATPV